MVRRGEKSIVTMSSNTILDEEVVPKAFVIVIQGMPFASHKLRYIFTRGESPLSLRKPVPQSIRNNLCLHKFHSIRSSAFNLCGTFLEPTPRFLAAKPLDILSTSSSDGLAGLE